MSSSGPKKSGKVVIKEYQVCSRRATCASPPPCSVFARHAHITTSFFSPPSKSTPFPPPPPSKPKTNQSDAFCRQLGPLVAKLAEDAPDARYDARALGLMVAQILQFQEDALGVNVRAQ
jgi:hypothetical protein